MSLSLIEELELQVIALRGNERAHCAGLVQQAIDALKAQPSGVVDAQRLLDWNRAQPEPRPIVVGREYQVAEACARLNSSPVSAGDIPFAGFDPNFCPGSNPENPQEDDGQTYMGEPVIRSGVLVDRTAMQRLFKACGCSGAVDNTQLVNLAANKLEAKHASAGWVDERAAFEAWRLEKFCGGAERLKKCSNAPDVYYYTAEQEAWKVWQARAALTASAPHHSEQVREVPADDRLEAAHALLREIQPALEQHGFSTWQIDELLAAAPSAGSQKEQGE